jgi:hypothetical protein
MNFHILVFLADLHKRERKLSNPSNQMSTTTEATTEAEGFTTTEAEASVAALNTTVDEAVNALSSAIEAAETVVAKFGMTIVRNKAPHFILESGAESPSKRLRFSDDIHAAAVGAAAAERAAELAEAVTAASAAEAAVEEAPAAIGRSLSG